MATVTKWMFSAQAARVPELLDCQAAVSITLLQIAVPEPSEYALLALGKRNLPCDRGSVCGLELPQGKTPEFLSFFCAANTALFEAPLREFSAMC